MMHWPQNTQRVCSMPAGVIAGLAAVCTAIGTYSGLLLQRRQFAAAAMKASPCAGAPSTGFGSVGSAFSMSPARS